MEKSKYFNRMLILFIVMAQYLLSILFRIQLWSDIASPMVAFLVSYMIWDTGRKREYYRLNWMLLALLAFFWGAADSLWMVASDIYGLDPKGMPIFMYLYLLPNIMLAVATVVYFLKNMKKWYKAQLALDIAITWIVASVFIWHIMLKNYNAQTISYDDIISTFLYLFADVLAVSVVFVMYSSSRVRKLGKSMRLIVYGIYLYALVDLYYIFLVFENAYVPNSIIDFIYMTSIIMFGAASIYEAYKPELVYNHNLFEVPENMGRSSNYVLLLVFPALFYFTGYFDLTSLVKLMVLVLLHQMLSNYIQSAMRSEWLLKKEKAMNEKLEETIAERTIDLVSANKALDELAKIDTLTGLYNRRFFLEELDSIINTAGSKFSLLYMDLDRFKIINDTHGHEMGDKLLKVISDRLNGWKPEGVLIARLGGDEFAVIARDCIEFDRLSAFCEQISNMFSEPIIVDSYAFTIGVSIGISRYPLDASDRDKLTKYADIAMYNAKKEFGSKKSALYNRGQSDIIEKRNEMEILLKNADFDKEFELNFQPQFDISSNRLIGAEALLRWNSPIKGRIPPNAFIPIAEENGTILNIGRWVMNKAISQIAYWNDKYQMDLIVGINISAKQIESIDFLSGIKKLIEHTGINTDWIDFEITESSAMNTNVVMEEILTELSAVGISISIDDFGTGYSSLSYIKRFDIDRLKIAKELIDNISSDRNAMLIVKAIIAMSKGMGLKTIAEGVETEEQLNILRMLGCNEVQGFFLGKPLAAEVFEKSFLEPSIAAAQNE